MDEGIGYCGYCEDESETGFFAKVAVELLAENGTDLGYETNVGELGIGKFEDVRVEIKHGIVDPRLNYYEKYENKWFEHKWFL